MSDRPKVLVLSFSRIATDARVLKQVTLLSQDFDVTTCGHGPTPPGVVEHVEVPSDLQAWRKDPRWLLLRQYSRVYRTNEAVAWARAHLPVGTFDAVLADDVEAVPWPSNSARAAGSTPTCTSTRRGRTPSCSAGGSSSRRTCGGSAAGSSPGRGRSPRSVRRSPDATRRSSASRSAW